MAKEKGTTPLDQRFCGNCRFTTDFMVPSKIKTASGNPVMVPSTEQVQCIGTPPVAFPTGEGLMLVRPPMERGQKACALWAFKQPEPKEQKDAEPQGVHDGSVENDD